MPYRRFAAGLLLLVLFPSCHQPSEHQAVYPDAPVFLISIDTLRSDRLPAYGHEEIATPAIDRLAADGIVFERAFSNYPITLPSHTTILTGLLPTEHGVRDNVGYRFDSENGPFLPRFFKQHGYLTGGAVSVFLLRRDTGLGSDFDFFEDAIGIKSGASLGESQRSGSDTLAASREWLRSTAAQNRPFFFFFHIYEPHTPWEPPEPFASQYGHPYDGEVAAADRVVAALLSELDQLDVYDKSIILLLSDHGEGLGDHREQEHGILLNREALQIPLILKLPGGSRAGSRVAAAAQLADVYATLVRLVGGSAAGTSLIELLGEKPPQRDIYAETFYPRFHLGWNELHSLVSGDLHLIEGSRVELFDIEEDPRELQSAIDENRSELVRMRAALAAMETEAVAPGEVDAETAEQLASLGYLASQVDITDGPLPDPRDNLHLLNDLYAAVRAQHAGDFASAASEFRAVLDENPKMIDAWENLALSLQRLGRFKEAEDAFVRALQLSGGIDHVALGLARLYLETGRFADARAHAELARTTNPASAHRLLARIALAENDHDEAERHALAALQERQNAVEPWIVLAQISIKGNDLATARERLAEAEAAQELRRGEDPAQGLCLTRGDVRARLGEATEAEAQFRREIELYPHDPRAYARLSLLLYLQGRINDAIATLRRMVESQETSPAYATAVETLRVLGDPASAAALLDHALSRFPNSPQLLNMREANRDIVNEG